MSVYALGLVLRQCYGLSPTQKLVLLAMADCADTDEANIFPSIAALSSWTGYAEDTVKKVRRELREAGALERVAEGGQGPASTARYRIDVDRLLCAFGAPREGSVQARVLAEMAERGRQPRLCPGHPLLVEKGLPPSTLSPVDNPGGEAEKGGWDGSKGLPPSTQTLTYNPQREKPGRARDAAEAGEGCAGDKQQACGPVQHRSPGKPGGGAQAAGASASGEGGEGSAAGEGGQGGAEPGSLSARWLAVQPEILRRVGAQRYRGWVAKLIPWCEDHPPEAGALPVLLLRAPTRFSVDYLVARGSELRHAMTAAWREAGGGAIWVACEHAAFDRTLPPAAFDQQALRSWAAAEGGAAGQAGPGGGPGAGPGAGRPPARARGP